MNPCTHPSLLTTHGQFLSHKKGPGPQRTLVPLFSYSGTMLHHDIRPPVPYGWKFESDPDLGEDEDDLDGEEEDGAFEGDVPWFRKTNERLDWRGRTTGMYASPDTWWVHGHRARLVTLTNTLEGNVGVLRVPMNESGTRAELSPVGEPESVPLSRVNPAWMDIAFTEKPIACDQDRGTCDVMEKLWAFQGLQKRPEEGLYKFIIDVSAGLRVRRFDRRVC